MRGQTLEIANMESKTLGDRLLTVKEIAAYLGLAVGTIYNKVASREIPFERVGTNLRFRRSTIDEWIQTHPPKSDDGEAA